MKKVVILSKKTFLDNTASGYEKTIFQMAKRYYERGDTVYWFGLGDEDTIDSGIIYKRSSSLFSLITRLVKFIFEQNEEIDLVLDYLGGASLITKGLLKRKKVLTFYTDNEMEVRKKVSSNIKSTVLNFTEKVLLKRLINHPIITFSKSVRTQIAEIVSNDQLVSVIPNAVSNTYKDFKDRFKKDFVLVSMINDLDRDNVPDQLELINILKEKVSELKLIIICNDSEQCKRQDVKNMIQTRQLDAFVKLVDLKQQSSLDNILKHSYLYISTSVSDGLSYGIKRSALFGTPAIGYDAPGIRDNIAHMKTGLVAFENSPEALSKLALRLIRDRRLYELFGKECSSLDKRVTYDQMFEKINFVIDTFTPPKASLGFRFFL